MWADNEPSSIDAYTYENYQRTIELPKLTEQLNDEEYNQMVCLLDDSTYSAVEDANEQLVTECNEKGVTALFPNVVELLQPPLGFDVIINLGDSFTFENSGNAFLIHLVTSTASSEYAAHLV